MIDGRIIVGDVAKDSPAEKSGLRENDVVLAINKNFTQNLNLYKAALQNTSGNVQIIVVRNDQLVEFKFRVKDILRNK
jgi:predicted metalloprotease with PDZ domain